MANMTIAVDDHLLRAARIKALAKKVRAGHEPLWPGREALYADPRPS